MALRLSFSNLAAAATVTATSEDLVYAAVNARAPERPFLPWKTGALGDQRLVIDFAATTALDAVALVRTNFASATIQGNDTDVWTSPSYDEDITIAVNPWSGRYQHAHRVVAPGFSYRYLSILIPSQTPVDGASAYLLGGVWAGLLAATPRSFLQEYQAQRIEPRQDIGPDSRAWQQRLTLGEPRVSVKVRLQALTGRPPGVGDELGTWLGLQRTMASVDVFLASIEDSDPGQAWIVRSIAEPQWSLDNRMATADAELMESVGP